MRHVGSPMRESGLVALLVGLALALLVAAVMARGAEAQEACDVVLDPGHGGTDWGATYTFPQGSTYPGTTLYEKHENLEVAYLLKDLLDDNYAVCMTRTGDQTLSNNDRYTYANSTGAKILVSIHMNASSDSSTDYTTTLYGKWRKDKELALTVFDNLSTLPAASGTGTIATRTPYSYASGVLLKSNMPATIAETVFITNDDEAQLLAAGTRQYEIADALRMGIERYLSLSPSQPDSGGGEEDSGGHPKGGPPGKNK